VNSQQSPNQYLPTRFTDEGARERAEACGCQVEYSQADELQLDIDSEDDLEFFLSMMGMIEDLNIVSLRDPVMTVRRSKSGKRHVTVHLGESLPAPTRILLQACLGSDRRRELLSYVGLLRGQGNPILFFRPKGESTPCDLPF
jgi:hypothetical protein